MKINMNTVAEGVVSVIDAVYDSGANPESEEQHTKATRACIALGAQTGHIRDVILDIQADLEDIAAGDAGAGAIYDVLEKIGAISTKGEEDF